ncbi:hypothetical protein BN946_scf184973.g4 [Trametes cinnabarina]|uniref:Uncharacterized protein n=1 Tax=Pycnoporus cinnabarinus TaxID=5643 RepID=A0A060SCI6_PYCCI|nr:hypothetical protein BN946_scf184973.g4 [Trametes cinnabarina]
MSLAQLLHEDPGLNLILRSNLTDGEPFERAEKRLSVLEDTKYGIHENPKCVPASVGEDWITSKTMSYESPMAKALSLNPPASS